MYVYNVHCLLEALLPSAIAYVRVCHAGMSRCHACGLRNSECHVCVCMALAIGARSSSLEDLARTAPGRVVWRRTERDLQVVEEESVVFSNIEVRVKRAEPSGLGDLEVMEYIACIRSGPFERKDGTSVHLATTEARFMPD